MLEFTEHKSKFLSLFFRIYSRLSIKRNFFRVNIKGLEELKVLLKKSNQEKIPIIFCLNHSNWWDGALICWLSLDLLKVDGYSLMEEKQLIQHRYFSKIGAIPIIRENHKHCLQALNFCFHLLNKKNKALWIFPQGEIIPNEKSPLKFFNGISYLIEEIKRVILVNCLVEYRFTSEQRPEIFINFFESKNFNGISYLNRKEFTNQLERKFENEIEEFKIKFLNKDLDDYELVLKGKTSIDKKRFTQFL